MSGHIPLYQNDDDLMIGSSFEIRAGHVQSEIKISRGLSIRDAMKNQLLKLLLPCIFVFCASYNQTLRAQSAAGACFAISDSAIGEAGSTGDVLFSLDLSDIANTASDDGPTGTNLAEASEFVTSRNKLYFGNGTEIWVSDDTDFSDASLCAVVPGATDIDGLSYSRGTDTFYISDRLGTGSPGGGAGGAGEPEDQLITVRIDDSCVLTSLGTSTITTLATTGLADVDDIAVDPFTGRLYGAVNTSNSDGTFLVEINPLDGSVVSTVQLDMPYGDIDDVEGMTFTHAGVLIVSTGESAGTTGNGEGPNSSEVYEVNLLTGVGVLLGDINDGAGSDRSDFESITCGQPTDCPGPYSLIGTVFNQDAAAPQGIGGVLIKLRDDNRNVIGFETTAADGSYEFTITSPGLYDIDVNETTIPAGLIATNETNGQTIDIDLTCAPYRFDIPYRTIVPGIIGDFVWYDYCTGDGIADATELTLGLEGAPLDIIFDGASVATRTTDSFGNYYVDGLPGGEYTVEMNIDDPIVEAFLDLQIAEIILSDPVCPAPVARKLNEGSNLYAESTTPTTITDTLPPGGSNPDFDYGLEETLLDVSLIDFNVEMDEDQAVYTWSTRSETDFSGFQIEIMADAEADFREIAFVEGQGGESIETQYRYEYSSMPNGLFQTRLKMLDIDGRSSYSPVLLVDNRSLKSEFALYPNPASNSSTFTLQSNSNEEFHVRLIDQLGREVETLYSGVVKEGQAVTKTIDVSQLSPGMYILDIAEKGISSQIPYFVVR